MILKKLVDKIIKKIEQNKETSFNMIECDQELTAKLRIIPYLNNKCHINAIALNKSIADDFYDSDIYCALCINPDNVTEYFVHFLVGVQEQEGSEIKYVDPTLGFTNNSETLINLIVSTKEDRKPIRISKEFKDIMDMFHKHPNRLLIVFKDMMAKYCIRYVKEYKEEFNIIERILITKVFKNRIIRKAYYLF